MHMTYRFKYLSSVEKYKIQKNRKKIYTKLNRVKYDQNNEELSEPTGLAGTDLSVLYFALIILERFCIFLGIKCPKL